MTEYDEQDQAYQDLLEEADQCRDMCTMLKALIRDMCDLIYYQSSLKEQDRWLNHCVALGLHTIEEE